MLIAFRSAHDRAHSLLHRVLLLLLASEITWADTVENFRQVSTAIAFQRAVIDGVKHIVVSDHMDTSSLQADPEGVVSSLDSAIGDIQPSTLSIVVRPDIANSLW